MNPNKSMFIVEFTTKYGSAYSSVFNYIEHLNDLTDIEKNILTKRIILLLEAHRDFLEYFTMIENIQEVDKSKNE